MSAKQAKADSEVPQAIAGWAILVGAGFGIYYLVHHQPTLTGCAEGGEGALHLQNQRDRQTYDLIGDVSEIKVGDLVRVSGKKRKPGAATGERRFLVEKTKDFGPCKVVRAGSAP